MAVKNHYVMPTVDDSGVIDIKEGRHPVVEKVLKDAWFVPNDTYMAVSYTHLDVYKRQVVYFQYRAM